MGKLSILECVKDHNCGKWCKSNPVVVRCFFCSKNQPFEEFFCNGRLLQLAGLLYIKNIEDTGWWYNQLVGSTNLRHWKAALPRCLPNVDFTSLGGGCCNHQWAEPRVRPESKIAKLVNSSLGELTMLYRRYIELLHGFIDQLWTEGGKH